VTRRVWHRSLYWRVALGLLALLLATLAVQAMVFLWIAARQAERLPVATLAETAETVASELSARLEDDPSLDLEAWLREHYGRNPARVFVRMRGRAPASNQPGERLPARLPSTGHWRGRRRPFGRGPGGGMIASAPLVLEEQGRELVAGEVIALLPRPRFLVVREIAPLVLGAGLLLALIGTAAAAWIIFGPANRRLRRLEQAADRLGSGDRSARAPEEGGDEIASVAAAFNRMAGELADAERARRQLLADVSHELATPLTAIRGYAETLAHPQVPDDAGARARYVGIIREEVDRLEALVGDLLDLARLDADRSQESLAPAGSAVDVSELFARVVERYQMDANSRNVTLRGVSGADARTVGGDARRLEQALSNLVANALRHTRAGGQIDLTSGRKADGIILSVRDTGTGIEPEHLAHVFDRFYKTEESRTGGAAGSGLGLSIVKAIAERHGGHASARSKPNVETVFEIWLPLTGSSPHTQS
jgi:signal transduction histidine kinase